MSPANRLNTNALALSLVLMTVALVLGAAFALLTFDRFYRDGLIAPYRLPALGLQSNLQRAALGGLDLSRARGVRRDIGATQAAVIDSLERAAAQAESGIGQQLAAAVFLVDASGEVLAQVGGDDVGARLPASYMPALNTPNGPTEAARDRRFIRADGHYLLPLRIFAKDGEWIASVVVRIDERVVDVRADTIMHRGLWLLGFTVLGFVLLYGFVLAVACLRGAGFRKSELLWLSGCVGAFAQLLVAVSGAALYIEPYERVAVEGASTIVAAAERDVEAAMQRRIRLEDLDFQHYPWAQQLTDYPEVAAIDVVLPDGRLLARIDAAGARHRGAQASAAEDPLSPTRLAQEFAQYRFAYAHLELDGSLVGHVVGRVSLDALRTRVLDMAADGLAATMVALLLFMEVLLLGYLRLAGSADDDDPAAALDKVTIVRPAAFLMLFGLDMSMSFVPLYMQSLYEPLFGLEKDIVLGLPISMEYFTVGFAILAAGVWIDKQGWRAPFLLGVLVAGVGSAYSWVATDAINFIISRGIVGIGFGLVLMASQGYVIAYTDARSKATGLAHLFAGVYGGSIAGGVAGAIIAEKLGFAPVFLIGTIIVFSVLLYSWRMLPTDTLKLTAASAAKAASVTAAASASGGQLLWRFLSNRIMLALIFLSSLPASIAAVGLLNYFSPIYLSRAGASQSTIGQVLMLYGVCLVILGPWVSRGMDTVERKRLAVVAGCIVGAAALFCFNALQGIVAGALAVLVLGISHSLILSSQAAYALALRVSRDLGDGKSISIFRSTGRIGQMLGPIAFGGVMLSSNIEQVITYIGVGYLVCAALFWLTTMKHQHLIAEGEV